MSSRDERSEAASIARRRASAAMMVLCSTSIAGLAPAALSAEEISNSWEFAATIYGWFPDIGGDTTLPFGDSSIDVDVSTILDHLKMTGQGSFEFHKGRWGAFTDLIYLDIGDSKSQTRQIEIGGNPLPAGVTANANLDLKTVIWTLAGSYRFVSSPEASVDLLVGARLASMKENFDWQFTGDFGSLTPPPRTGSREESVDQWDGIVGIKGRFALGADRSWVIPYYADIGTGDSDLTWQAMLGLGYAFGWGDVGIAWRYLDYDLNSDGPIKDLNFNGPALGVALRW